MVVTISVEMVSSNTGLGGMIWLSWQSFAVEKLFVSVAIAGLMGAFFHVSLRWLENRLIPWRAAPAG
jgi:ABC-type nitrate/sulfonate/bicarbonate transport system permease component